MEGITRQAVRFRTEEGRRGRGHPDRGLGHARLTRAEDSTGRNLLAKQWVLLKGRRQKEERSLPFSVFLFLSFTQPDEMRRHAGSTPEAVQAFRDPPSRSTTARPARQGL